MSGAYDKVIKENIEELFLKLSERFLGVRIVATEALPAKLQTTLEREADFLRIARVADGDPFLLHLEFQTQSERDMVYRMAEYKAILQRKYRLPVRQIVLYFGATASQMPTQLPPEAVIEGFELLDVRRLSTRELLASEVPEELLLAILGDYAPQEAAAIVRQVISRLQALCDEEIRLRKYLKQLLVLSRLRKLEAFTQTIIDAMPITYDIETDGLYLKGIEKGRERGLEEGRERGLEEGRERGLEEGRERGLEEGRERGLEESASAMLAAGFSAEQVAQWLGLPLARVRALTDTPPNTKD